MKLMKDSQRKITDKLELETRWSCSKTTQNKNMEDQNIDSC